MRYQTSLLARPWRRGRASACSTMQGWVRPYYRDAQKLVRWGLSTRAIAVRSAGRSWRALAVAQEGVGVTSDNLRSRRIPQVRCSGGRGRGDSGRRITRKCPAHAVFCEEDPHNNLQHAKNMLRGGGTNTGPAVWAEGRRRRARATSVCYPSVDPTRARPIGGQDLSHQFALGGNDHRTPGISLVPA